MPQDRRSTSLDQNQQAPGHDELMTHDSFATTSVSTSSLQNSGDYRQITMLASLSTLAACGGGGSDGGSSDGGSVKSNSSPVVGDSEPKISATGFQRVLGADEDAAQFLQQAQFTSTISEIADVRKIGAEEWLIKQMNMPPYQSGWDWLVANKINTEDNDDNTEFADAAIWYQLMKAPDCLKKRVALALSEIFVVNMRQARNPSPSFHVIAYWDLLNKHAFGNYRALLEAVTLSPMMGVFLGTLGNKKPDPAKNRVPDENYAREIMQLFSIGVFELNVDGTVKKDPSGKPLETYDQKDIMALANVFTGWKLDDKSVTTHTSVSPGRWRVPMIMNEADHSSLPVSCLKKNGYSGITIPANTKGVDALKIALDGLFNHPNVAPFICKQLIQRLVTSNPSPKYVADVAGQFNNNGNGVRGDLRAVVRAILIHPEAKADAASDVFGKLREPMLRYVQWSRTFNAKPLVNASNTKLWTELRSFDSPTSLAQSPLRAPSVFNFFRPGFVPNNNMLGQRGLLAPEFQILDEISAPGYANFMRDCITNSTRGNQVLVADYSQWTTLADNPTALVDRLILVLNAGRYSRRAKLIEAVASISNKRENYKLARVYFAIIAVMVSTDYIVQR